MAEISTRRDPQEIFAVDLTSAVSRCPGCGEVMLRLVQSAHSIWLDLAGTVRLQIPI